LNILQKFGEFLKENSVNYAIIVDLEKASLIPVGSSESLLFDGMIKTNFYDIETALVLNDFLKTQYMPKVFKQGEVMCVITKPNDDYIIGLFYHDDRKAKEVFQRTEYLNERAKDFWSTQMQGNKP